jgi:predicted nucleic acid-binding protein
MHIYLDLGTIKRPFDDHRRVRIALQNEAILMIMSLIEAGKFVLVSSEILLIENYGDPSPFRQTHCMRRLENHKRFVRLDSNIKQRADQLVESYNIFPLDALHLASAEISKVHYFCTCDDELHLQMKNAKLKRMRVVLPVELLQEAP